MKTILKFTIKEYHEYLYKIFIFKQKKIYKCLKCSYKNDRYNHTKMHFLRIHINNGKPVKNKRKF